MTDLPFNPSDLAWLSRLATALVGDPQAGDDIAQEAVLAALQRREGISKPRAWLAGAVRRLAARRIRTETRRRRRETVAAAAERLPDAAELLARAETAEAVLAATRRLPDPFRRTVYLRFLEGLSTEEIARREGHPADTVRARLRRGLTMLREDLIRSGHSQLSEGAADWPAWCALLTPLAPDARLPAAASAAGSAALSPTTLSAMTLNTKLLAAGTICTLALAWGIWGGWDNASSAPPALANPEGTTAALDPVDNRPPPEDRPPIDQAVAREAIPATTAERPAPPARPGLRGKVVDGQGAPVANASVFTRIAGIPTAKSEPLAIGTSAADGSFRLSLPAATTEDGAAIQLELGACAAGFTRGFTPVADPAADVVVKLERGREVRGIVFAADGVGVSDLDLLIHTPGAKVAHVSPSQVSRRAATRRVSGSDTAYEDARVRTNARGQFVASGLPAGPLAVRALNPEWVLTGDTLVEAGSNYAELQAQQIFAVRIVSQGDSNAALKATLRATFRAELTFANGQVEDYGQWVGRGDGIATFGLAPDLLPPSETRTIVRARFYGEVSVNDGLAQSWEAPPIERGTAEVNIDPGLGATQPSKDDPATLPETAVDLDVRFADGTALIGPVSISWQHQLGARDSRRATAVSPGRYRVDVPLGQVTLRVAEGNASGSLDAWTEPLTVREDGPVLFVTLPRGAAAQLPRPQGWTGEWFVRASWRPDSDAPWRGSWNYSTDAAELTLRALRVAEWRFELTSPLLPNTPPLVRTFRLRQPGDSVIVDR